MARKPPAQHGSKRGRIAERAYAFGAGLPPPLTRAAERVVWGGERRERLLLGLLRCHYESLFRRQWFLADEPPHYFDHRIDGFAFVLGVEPPFSYRRGFFATELIHQGDVLLDIGCGDGFFTRRFFAPLCRHVDALDVEAAAISHAKRLNSAENIAYHLLDAVSEPFPRDSYDVVVLDGALAHFAAARAARLLAKISATLAPNGVFAGSESLGAEGHDHLQFFDTLDDLALTLRAHFPEVELRSMEYPLPSGVLRHEAYWRCAAERNRLDDATWHDARHSRRIREIGAG